MAAIWFAIGRVVVKPVTTLSQMADGMSRGKGLDVDIVSKSKDEIGDLYASFNRMRKSVIKLIRMVKQKKG